MQHKGEQKVRYVTKSNRKGKKDQRQPLDLECKFSFFSEASQKKKKPGDIFYNCFSNSKKKFCLSSSPLSSLNFSFFLTAVTSDWS